MMVARLGLVVAGVSLVAGVFLVAGLGFALVAAGIVIGVPSVLFVDWGDDR